MIKILSSWRSQAWSDRWSFYGASLSELAVALRNYDHLAALMWVSKRVRKYVIHSPPVPPGMAWHVLLWPKFTTRLAGYVASRILWREKISSWSQDTSRTWYRLLTKLTRYCVSIIHYNTNSFYIGIRFNPWRGYFREKGPRSPFARLYLQHSQVLRNPAIENEYRWGSNDTGQSREWRGICGHIRG